jgi:hypothetical protein
MNCQPSQNSITRHLEELDQMCAGGLFLFDDEPETLAAEADARDWEKLGWVVDGGRS